jgi:DNA-directed RNA polymerase III subunit RPC1
MSAHGINLDLRHILLAADTMTFKGKVLGFTRHGVQKLKNSTL